LLHWVYNLLNDKSIVGWEDLRVGLKFCFQFAMAGQLVGEVSDPGVAGTDSFSNFQGAFEAEV
jgi:hypothetical protein